MFDDKKKGLEKIIDLDTQKKFKVTATRNKSLGRWAGEQLGLEKSKIDGYVDEVIMADFEKPGFEDVIKKILNDFKKAGISISYNEIKETLLKYEKEAINKISEQFLISSSKLKGCYKLDSPRRIEPIYILKSWFAKLYKDLFVTEC